MKTEKPCIKCKIKVVKELARRKVDRVKVKASNVKGKMMRAHFDIDD